jgi:hypothetical protein
VLRKKIFGQLPKVRLKRSIRRMWVRHSLTRDRMEVLATDFVLQHCRCDGRVDLSEGRVRRSPCTAPTLWHDLPDCVATLHTTTQHVKLRCNTSDCVATRHAMSGQVLTWVWRNSATALPRTFSIASVMWRPSSVSTPPGWMELTRMFFDAARDASS